MALWKIFQSDCTILHSHQQWTNNLVSLHPHQHLMLSLFFISAILVYMLTVVLIYIFLKMLNIFLHTFFSFTFFYCCSSTVVSIFPTTTLPYPSHPHFPPLIVYTFSNWIFIFTIILRVLYIVSQLLGQFSLKDI